VPFFASFWLSSNDLTIPSIMPYSPHESEGCFLVVPPSHRTWVLYLKNFWFVYVFKGIICWLPGLCLPMMKQPHGVCQHMKTARGPCWLPGWACQWWSNLIKDWAASRKKWCSMEWLCRRLTWLRAMEQPHVTERVTDHLWELQQLWKTAQRDVPHSTCLDFVR